MTDFVKEYQNGVLQEIISRNDQDSLFLAKTNETLKRLAADHQVHVEALSIAVGALQKYKAWETLKKIRDMLEESESESE
jgi:uncharacterized protein HemY